MAPGNKLTEYFVKQELRNLNMEDAHRRHIAMNALTKHVQVLDVNEVPNFLKQVSQALHKSKPTSISCHVNAISLYEQAVRRHGASLVCQLGIIICMLRFALNLVGFNTTLQQACVKLVRSIANYVICTSENREMGLIEEIKEPASFLHHAVHSCGVSGPQMNNLQKTHGVYCQQILKDLCSPLLEKVGEAPRCLHALVETPGWKFASQDLVNQSCLQATRGLLLKGSQAVGHMQLICSLAKKNGLALKPHVGTLLKAVAEMLDKGSSVHNWQQRLCSVQMINGFVKISSAFELQEIIWVLEIQREDKMPCVRKAVAETIHRAKLVLEDQCFQVEERICNSVVLSCSSGESTGSNEHEAMEGFGDSYVKPVSGFNSEWSVRNNPIAGDEIQGNLIVPVYTNGKDIIVDLKGEIIVEGLGLLWGSDNYPGRRQACMEEKCSGESSEVERSDEISSVSSVNMDSIGCHTDLEDTERREKFPSIGGAEAELEEVVSTGNREKMIKEGKSRSTDLKDTGKHEIFSSNAQAEPELEEVTPIGDCEPEFEEVPSTGNCEKMFKEDKSCYTDLVNTGGHEKFSSKGQVEVVSNGNYEKMLKEDEICYTDLKDADEHEELSSDGKAEAELEEVLRTGNCEKMIKEDKISCSDFKDTGEKEKLSNNGQVEADLEDVVPSGNCDKIIKQDQSCYTDLEDVVPSGNCEKIIKEDQSCYTDLKDAEGHEKLSSNGQAGDEMEEVVPAGKCEKMIENDKSSYADLEDREMHEKLSSNGKAEAGLDVVPIGNCEKMIKEDLERRANLSSNGEAETELEEVLVGKRHKKLSSNGQAEAELEEQEPIENCEKMMKEDPERHEKLSSEAEAELEEVVPIGYCEKMIEEDPERHENLSSNGEAETELEEVPIGKRHENLSSNGEALTELQEVPIGKRHEELSSNGQAEAELEEQLPIRNCEKRIKEDRERHEKLSSEAETDLKEVVPTGNSEKMIKEDPERHENLASNREAETELEEVPIGKRHEILSSNAQAEAELEEQESIRNCEKMIKENPERHEKLSSEAEAELEEVLPTGDYEKMVKEDPERHENLSSNGEALTELEEVAIGKRHERLSSNSQAAAELEDQVPIGNCEKMIKEDRERHGKLSNEAEADLKEVVAIGNCEKVIKEDAERHEKLSSNGEAEAELEEVPIGNCEKMIKEDAERQEKLSSNGDAKAELEVVPIGNCDKMIKEDPEWHENFTSNGEAEAELEEVVPIGNYDKMIKEDTERHENLSSSGEPEDELEEVPTGNSKKMIEENRERLDNSSSNGPAEAEFEELLPIGNYEKMIEEDKSSAHGWPMKMGQISLSSVFNKWSKAIERTELILGVSLCAGLIVSAALFSIKSFFIHEDNHVLVPT